MNLFFELLWIKADYCIAKEVAVFIFDVRVVVYDAEKHLVFGMELKPKI
jgi:hypothetical protein